MTVLGKILAILNLVLSLAVGAFIVMTYVSRTNWYAAYQNMNNQVKVAQADARAFKDEADKARKDRATTDEQFATYKATAEKEKGGLNAQLSDLGNKWKQAQADNAKHVAALSSAGEELSRRAKEIDYLKELAAKRDDQLRKGELQNEQMRAAMVEAQINFAAERDRNDRLLQENERLTRDYQHVRQVATSTNLRSEGARKNPPIEDINGRVTAIDRDNGLVTVNVGSDAGLSKGNTLETYRLKPDPAYLGTIQILEVQPNRAVGRPVNLRPGVIQVGDQVSSNIMSRR